MLVGLHLKPAERDSESSNSRVQRPYEGAASHKGGRAIEGGKLRFRPILMTSFAFIAGLVPLLRAGFFPGAIGNRTIGTTAVGGMLLGTLIGVLVIPGLYYLFAKLAGDGKTPPGRDTSASKRGGRTTTAAPPRMVETITNKKICRAVT